MKAEFRQVTAEVGGNIQPGLTPELMRASREDKMIMDKTTGRCQEPDTTPSRPLSHDHGQSEL